MCPFGLGLGDFPLVGLDVKMRILMTTTFTGWSNEVKAKRATLMKKRRQLSPGKDRTICAATSGSSFRKVVPGQPSRSGRGYVRLEGEE